jgi:hypothetical protein
MTEAVILYQISPDRDTETGNKPSDVTAYIFGIWGVAAKSSSQF